MSGKRCAGQLSLEYLLLLAAFFSCFLLFLPLLQKSYALALFGFDARNASLFVESVKQGEKELAVLGEGSALSLQINPINSWQVEIRENRLSVLVASGSLGKTKGFEEELSAAEDFSRKSFTEKTALVLSKKGGKLIVNS